MVTENTSSEMNVLGLMQSVQYTCCRKILVVGMQPNMICPTHSSYSSISYTCLSMNVMAGAGTDHSSYWLRGGVQWGTGYWAGH